MKNSILTIIVLIGMLVAPFVAESAQAAVAIEISDIDANDVTISVRGEILHVFRCLGCETLQHQIEVVHQVVS